MNAELDCRCNNEVETFYWAFNISHCCALELRSESTTMFTDVFDFCLITLYHPVLILIGNFLTVYAFKKRKIP